MRFFELFFVPLRRESRETAPARQLMQASLLSLRSAFLPCKRPKVERPLGLSKNRSFGTRNFTFNTY